MEAEPRAALFACAEGDEGSAEAALGACRAAEAEGLRSCMLLWGSEPYKLAAKTWRQAADADSAPFVLGRHPLKILRGMPGDPDVLELALKENFLRDVVTAERQPGGGDLRTGLTDVLLSELGKLYDVTVIVTGPVIADPYALILADSVPGVVIVIRSGKTRLAEATRVKSLVEAAGGSIVGAVMTYHKQYLPDWLARRL
ncbi:hypothetical protein ACFQI3_07975 [Hansschlegelia quercus]|uniref:Tyrosine-protein kinase family protein n=1 Tax=Hansschlegelia quercus TaxID=2528245 RepID=A0A4Q9GMU4_9HYPH|nr:tyrosine-protein kinase family protein [Hansschlegelia quercus]TBN54044.1 tyrosine-protein kinase family protein [Hansschlegelia quercus]